ncbi:hypothetical protein K432DRAFT_131387 [Lepidopterella palustris CBS 459.81]|uniref:Uncharacterized protein n=1 Tax=Lepidopterella palustris CBS 459.81 TaxID=1314670 RepID=A0A8E2EI85_9PEZI|nr:hypothetical protein K432DRAFT_131387 [Lepidopterella palustris CBS 459.81]
MPSFGRRQSHDSTTRDVTKQVLADINAGSQKARRKLLSNNPPSSHKRGNSYSTITPVTILDPQENGSREGRTSTSSSRPRFPRRSSSMRRAYNYFFGGPTAPTTPTTENTADNTTRDTATPDEAPDTPSTEAPAEIPDNELADAPADSPMEAPAPPVTNGDEPLAVQVEKLKARLVTVQEELDEANKVVSSQNEEFEALERQSEALKAEYEDKQAALQQEKKTLEDHMVSIVVQQVKETTRCNRRSPLRNNSTDYRKSWMLPRIPRRSS